MVPRVPTVPKVLSPIKVPSVPAPKASAPESTSTPGTLGPSGTLGTSGAPGTSDLRDRLLAEIKSAKSTFYNLVVAQAFRIDAGPDGISFVFQPNQKNARQQCEDQRPWLQQIAEKVAGKAIPVSVDVTAASTQPAPAPASVAPVAARPATGGDPKAEAMANATVQAVLEIFPVDKTTVEET